MKNNGEASHIFPYLKPIIFLSQISGVAFFRPSNKQIVFYRLFVIAILILCFVHEIPTVAFWISSTKSLHAVLAAFETSLRWALLFFNNMVTAFRNIKIKRVVESLINLKLDIEKSALQKAYRYQISRICFNFFLISCFMVLGHNFIWYNINRRWYTALIYIFTEWYIALGNLQFQAFAYIFCQSFKALNGKLLILEKTMRYEGRLFVSNKEGNYLKLQVNNLRGKHLKLTRLICELNDCYTIQLLFFILLSFVEIVYSLRAFFLHAVNKKTSEVWELTPILAFIHMTFWGSYYFLAVMQIIALCDSIVNEKKYTIFIVHKMINKTKNFDLERELELFSMQILQNDIRLVACGFFKLDFALLHTMIAAVTTYLVVLISLREDTG